MRRYTYTLMLSISIVVVGLLFGPPQLGDRLQEVLRIAQGKAYAGVNTQEQSREQSREPDRQVSEMKPVIRIENDEEAKIETPVSQGAVVQEESKPVSDAPVGNFEDTLFIGDSRTVGLKEYADLGEADVFASSGMSVFKVFDTSVPVKGKGKLTLKELLTAKEYKRIYLMLGINELGYEFSRSSGKYREVVEKIQELQPHAVLYLEANLYVTKHKSDLDPVYQNAGIDKFNRFIQDMTDGSSLIYLDINPLFDDGTGNLAPEYTADDSHVLGRYYAAWAEWIKENSG